MMFIVPVNRPNTNQLEYQSLVPILFLVWIIPFPVLEINFELHAKPIDLTQT